MGFISWLQSLRSRNHDNHTRTAESQSHRRLPSSTTQDPDFNVKKEKRRSRGLSFSRSNDRRRSWFGGRPDADEDIPAVPMLSRPAQGTSSRDIPFTALPTSRPSAGRTTTGSRIDTLPSLPPVPVTVKQSTQPATATLPSDKRRSRGESLSRTKSNTSRRRSSSRPRSFWASSNPADDSEEEIPPVPALYRGDSTDSTHGESDNSDNGRVPRHPRRKTQEGGSKSRPVSVVSTTSRRSYVPRSAAKGFMASTNEASEQTRKSFRKSFGMEDGEAMVCLTHEQQIEWAKLMGSNGNKIDGEERPREASVEGKTTEDEDRGFSNAQALAALEFGTR